MRYYLQVTSKALPGREEEYDAWYENTHVGDVLALPGFLSCQRYRKLAAGTSEEQAFVSMYEVETDDPNALLQLLFAESQNMQLTDAIDPASPRFEFLQPDGDLHRAKK